MAAGHGGQILVAATTVALIDDLDFVDLGLRQLRGLSAPLAIFQVRAGGAASGVPAVAVVGASPGNLPRQVTTFVGREPEIASLAIWFASRRW